MTTGIKTTIFLLYTADCRLKRLHLYGISCITAATLKCLLSQCKYITDFNIGRCCKVHLSCLLKHLLLISNYILILSINDVQVNNDCLEIVANKVPHLQWLELRGCMQVSQLKGHCPDCAYASHTHAKLETTSIFSSFSVTRN